MKWLFVALALYASFSANGQMSLGPEIGINVSMYSTPYNDRYHATGVRAGLAANVKTSRNIDVMTGVLYVNNPLGDTRLIGGAKPIMPVHCLELPVQVIYKFKPHGVTPFLGAGAYLDMNMSGKTTLPPGDIPSIQPIIVRALEVGYSRSDDMKPFDAGMSITGGFMLHNGLYIRMLYERGFVNLLPYGNNDNYMKRRNIGFSIGYRFHKKSSKQ